MSDTTFYRLILIPMDITALIVDLFTNADRFLVTLANDYGMLIYLAMWLLPIWLLTDWAPGY